MEITPKQANPDLYWAGLPVTDLLPELNQKIEDYYNYVQKTLLPIWKLSYYYYNVAAFNLGRVEITGLNNENREVGMNYYRNLIDNTVSMTVAQKPNWEARAINSDVESQRQCLVGKSLLPYYLREKSGGKKLKQSLFSSCLYSEGYIITTWNATSGKVIAEDAETGIKQYEGDIEYKSYTPIDVIRDTTLKNAENNQWYIIREYKNRYDIIAKYAQDDQEVHDAIISAGAETYDNQNYNIYTNAVAKTISPKSDNIEVFTLFHDRTPACPMGRQTLFTNQVILTDGPLPYDNLTVRRMAPGEMDFTNFGYTNNFDNLQVQEMLNVCYSSIQTVVETFGKQNISSHRDNHTEVREVVDGLNLIEYDESPPAALDLMTINPAMFQAVEMYTNTMIRFAKTNNTSLGEAEASQSGAALALLQQMSIQWNQGTQTAYVEMLEGVGTDTLRILRRYADVPRIAAIAGKTKLGMMSSFSKKDLSQIDRVQIDSANPMNDTIAGRVQKAEMLLKMGSLTDPYKLLEVLETGNLDTATDYEMNIILNIRKENEKLANGEDVPVLFTDNHIEHIKSHASDCSDPDIRSDPKKFEMFSKHINSHILNLSDPTYAQFMQLMGQPILPPQGAPGGQSVAPTNSPGAQGPGGNYQQSVQGMQPNLPAMPKVAGTNQSVEPVPGTATSANQ